MIVTPGMGFGMQTAMGIDGQITADLQTPASNKCTGLAHTTKPEGFELKHDNIGKAIVNFGKIDVLWFHPSHAKRMRRGKAQADLKKIGPVWNVIDRVGMAFGHTHNIYRIVAQVASALGRRDHHGTG